MNGTGRIRGLTVGLMIVLLGACAPAPPAAPAGGSQAAGQPAAPVAPAARKVITIAFEAEPVGIENFAGTDAGGRNTIAPIVHNQLAYERQMDAFVPQLATELPSLEKGTWRVNADGTMDMTWKVRPNIKWHDGTPFNTEDIVFAFNARKDPALLTNRATTGRPDLMERVSAPDPLTLEIHWSAIYADANQGRSLEPMPRHILTNLYENDKEGFGNSSYWNTQFIGLGPYRIVNWERGSHVEMGRYDDYFMGRPKLDTIIARFYGDPNAVVAAFMAGAIDVAGSQTGVTLSTAQEIRRRVEGTGPQVVTGVNGGFMNLEMQYREEHARPRNGFAASRTVRQALFQAMDRQALVEGLTEGASPVADSWIHPNHPFRKELEPFIPQFPYDPNRAQQLMGEAGWVKGADGVLVHQGTGERFESQLQTTQADGEKLLNVLADFWKPLGASFSPYVVPAALRSNREMEAKRIGIGVSGPSYQGYYETRLHSKFIPVESNRWSGINQGGYVNPRVDAALDKLAATIDPRQRVLAHRELIEAQLGDLALIPLYWVVAPLLIGKGVRGPIISRGSAITGTVFEWERE
jgi:peptide/nickel transport system substrate-binding protein